MATTLPTLTPLPQVAAQLNLSLRTLRERARRREFAHVRLGRERYLTDEQLRAFLKANTVPAESDTVAGQRAADLAGTARRVARSRRRAAA